MARRAGLLNRAASPPCGFKSHAFRFGSMVKRKSCHGSNVEFWVQILVGLLIDMVSVV